MDERRVRLATLATGVVLLLGAATVGYRLYVRPAQRLDERATSLHERLEEVRRRVAARPRLESEILSLRTSIRDGDERLLDDARLDDFVEVAGELARRHRVHMAKLEPGTLRAAQDARVLPVHVAVQGSFQRIYRWMVAVENAPHLARVASIEARVAKGSRVHAELRVDLYVRGSGQP